MVIPEARSRRHAIVIEFDVDRLNDRSMTVADAHAAIDGILNDRGLARQQGSVYFGNETINAVTCVMAAIDLSNQLSRFADSVRDIRMLRIEELNDLMPAIQQGR